MGELRTQFAQAVQSLDAEVAFLAVHKSNRRDASPPLLNHDLHAIDATPARWRGVVVYCRSFQPARAPDSLFDLRTGDGPVEALDHEHEKQ